MTEFLKRIINKEYRLEIFSLIAAGMNYASQQDANTTNNKIAKQNLKFQEKQLDYQKALQQEIFNREDTAHRREVNDLRQAGINPLATANGGQGLGAGAIVNTEAMHNDYEQKPVQIDPYAVLQEAAQMEAHRNNKATEKIEETKNENTRTKIESDEALEIRELERKELKDQQDTLTKMYEIASNNKNQEEMRKIQNRLADINERTQRATQAHYERQDALGQKNYNLEWNKFTNLDLPESERKRIVEELNKDETRAEIQRILEDTKLKKTQKYKLIENLIRDPINDIANNTEKATNFLSKIINSMLWN